MGEVYEARGRRTAQLAAVKLLNARATQSARRSSSASIARWQVAARLESPHIVKVLEVSAPDAPVPFIAMERLHGTDLATRLRSENRHAVRRARR